MVLYQITEFEWQKPSYAEYTNCLTTVVAGAVCISSVNADHQSPSLQQAMPQNYTSRGRIWRQADIPVPVVPAPTSSGWFDSDGKIKPLLTTLPSVPKACIEIICCRLTKGCISYNCSCRKADIPCCAACKCSDEPIPCTNRKKNV